MLTSRQLKVLKWIIEEYVRTAEPVGSKALASLPEFGLSSATIRNEMAELEQLGFIVKTHTSSGRVPSEEGYRLYVKELLESQNNLQSFPLIDEIFNKELISKEQAIKESMAIITDLTNYASVILGGSAYKSRIKKLQIVVLNERLAVILMVTDQGYVESKKIIIPDEINANDLERIVNLLNEVLYDCPILEIDNVLNNKLSEDDIREKVEYYDEIISILVRAFTNMAQDKFFLSGKTNILSQPEFQNIDKAKEIIEAIDKQEILRVINLNNSGISVKIGQDNHIKAMENCTIISVPFENEFGEQGAIAVIGPTRMEYHKIIPLLNYISKNIRNL